MGHIFGKLKVNSTRWILNLKIDLDMTPPLRALDMELEITHLYLHYARDELANDYAHSQRK